MEALTNFVSSPKAAATLAEGPEEQSRYGSVGLETTSPMEATDVNNGCLRASAVRCRQRCSRGVGPPVSRSVLERLRLGSARHPRCHAHSQTRTVRTPNLGVQNVTDIQSRFVSRLSWLTSWSRSLASQEYYIA